ncbi:MAG: Maf family protein [Actinomycetota bacterium]|nr:Maf family protein [Actinomycetota bacterium]MDA8293091.1 Maf family protein [Actinomycetota bacterium]
MCSDPSPRAPLRPAARRLILASGSPARLRLLRDAGFAPDVVVSGIDEGAADAPDTASLALALAERKALAVARADGDAVVVGCDSLLDVDGQRFGKPGSDEEAIRWLRDLRGHTGVLYTGHCLVDEATGRSVSAVEGTTVRFAETNDDELAAYVATGEATSVAGAFTLDGRSAPFVDHVVGNPSNVIGLSLPLFRKLLAELGLAVYELWSQVGDRG